jgi:hypothetical protein
MEFNIFTIGYLFLRLAPFILVSFFALMSIFNQDLKGIVYLVGLIFSCFITIIVGNAVTSVDFLSKYFKLTDVVSDERCRIFSINGIETNSTLSVPLSQSIFGFTYFYLVYFIGKNKVVSNNIATILFFPILILFDGYWNVTKSCFTIWTLGLSLSIGSVIGVFWAMIVETAKSPNLQFFLPFKYGEVCSTPSAQTFRCKVYKNGQLIQTA